MAALGYFREHAGGGATLAEQNRAFMDFCSKHGLPVRGTFADGTGANGRSPGFRELVSFLRSEGAAGQDVGDLTILIPSIDVLGQDLRDAAVRMYQLEGLGAHVRPMTGNFDDAEAALLQAWTEDGTGRMSARVRQAMRKKAVKGEVLGRPPYGYKVGALRRLELVPDEAVVVRYIFRLYLQEQIGIRLIARRLNEEGLKTRRGGNWSMVSIRDILRNRAYLGTYSRFDVHVSGSHPSLVSPADFHKVQERLTARRTSYAPKQTSQFLLSGLAYCGYCGNKLIGVSRKQSWKRQSGEVATNSYRYYQCESRTNQSMCGYHTRRADVLEEQVRERLAAAKGADTPAGSESGHHTDTEAAIEKLRSKVRSIDRKLEGFVDAAARGRIAREQMHAFSLKAAAERLALDDELEQLERDLERRHDTGLRRTSQQEGLQRLLIEWEALAFEARQMLMREVVCRVDVNDDGLSLALRA